MKTVFASAADERYGVLLLNLLGSVKANSDVFDAIVVYDLGLSPRQRRLIDSVRGVEVRTVPPFVPHWKQGRTWKTWIWTHLEADTVFWLDAGASVLRSLREPLAQVAERGYFVVGVGQSLGPSIPSDYFPLYDLPPDLGAREAITAGILAFDTRHAFYEQVIEPTYEDACRGRSLGFSEGEAEKFNHALDRMEEPLIRDCPRFRHEQTLLGIHFYGAVDEPCVNDVFEYGGFSSPKDHPEQLIWNHRRRADFRYLPRVPYKRGSRLFGWSFTARYLFKSWRRSHGWRLKPATYLRRLRRR